MIAMGGHHNLKVVNESELGDALLEAQEFQGEPGVERLAELARRPSMAGAGTLAGGGTPAPPAAGYAAQRRP